MTRRLTARMIVTAAVLVPRRFRQAWRREWQAELEYGWQRLGDRAAPAVRWRLMVRASSAFAHAAWLRMQEPLMDNLLQDARFALRLVRRAPGASFVAMLTLALGIGVNTAVFSIVNTVLVRPLPVDGLDRLVTIREDLPGLNLLQADLAPVEVVDLGARDDLFTAVTGFRAGDRTITGYGTPLRVGAATTVGDFAGVFSVRPQFGRFYGTQDSLPGSDRVVVLSDGLSRQLSGGNPGFIGHTVVLDDVPHRVIGVTPPGFRYPRGTDIWVPFTMTESWRTNRGSLFMSTVARLAPGVTDAQLRVGLEREVAGWNEAYATEDRFAKVLMSVGFIEYLAGPLRLILLVLFAAVMFVLLIAAANVAGLQLVRAVGRVREVAVRSAIGASRGRIFRQFLIESLVLSFGGGLLGLALGAVALRLIAGWGPAADLHLTGIGLDARVLGFTAAVTVFAALVFGTMPAVRSARVPPDTVLREQGRGLSTSLAGQHVLRASVVVQVALALVLLLGSGLMIRTLSQLLSADPGFEPAELVTARVSVPATSYSSNERRVLFFDELLARVGALPGVESAALVTGLPFAGSNDSSPFDILGRPADPNGPRRHAEAAAVSAGYFRTMGIPLLEGRAFDGTERAGMPIVTVIDETFAEQFFPGESPVGHRIMGYFGSETTIVGVVGRVDHDEIGDAPKALSYYPVGQQPWMTSRHVVVRSSLTAESVAAALREIAAALDPNVPVDDVVTMQGRIEQSLGPRRLALLALGVFSILSLVLAAFGVYGVMRYATGQRTREIGVRMALGARPGEVIGLVARQSLIVAVLGVTIGLAVAFATTRLMAGMLFGVSPDDPATFVLAGGVLLAVTVGAGLLPAIGAARVDPVSALRTE